MEPFSEAAGRSTMTTFAVLFSLDAVMADVGAAEVVLAWSVSSCIVVDIEKSCDEGEQNLVLMWGTRVLVSY